ncbi:PD-(D/E)XK nuclease superfamily protein [compost metagenome]
MAYFENGAYYVHNSEITTMKRCGLKWHYAYVRKLEPVIKPRPLYLGSVFHAGLQYLYLGKDANKAMALAVGEDIQNVIQSGKLSGHVLDDYIRESYTRLELCQRVMDGYIEYDKQYPIFGEGNLANLDGIPLIERTFEVPIEGLFYNGYPVMYRFTLDMAYERNGAIWLVDHKTGKQLMDVRKLDLDTQLSLYIWALGQVMDAPVVGMEYNLIRMVTPKEPQLVKKGDRLSMAAIDTTWDIFRDSVVKHGFDPDDYEDMQLKLMQKKFFDRKHRYRTANELSTAANELKMAAEDLIDESKNVYRNATNDCVWDCPYRELCIMEFKGEDKQSVDEYVERNFVIGVNRRESNDHIGTIIDKM